VQLVQENSPREGGLLKKAIKKMARTRRKEEKAIQSLIKTNIAIKIIQKVV